MNAHYILIINYNYYSSFWIKETSVDQGPPKAKADALDYFFVGSTMQNSIKLPYLLAKPIVVDL